MRVARTEAQAKINLYLRVGPRDASGYHEIRTLFQRIDLADVITVRIGGGARSIDCAGPQLPAGGLGAPEENLAYRAALAYVERTGWPRGFAIELTKRIPVGGGLGGGSADAGAVLRALDAAADQPVGMAALEALACDLGADVPFMASEHVRARASGRGEQLEPEMTQPSRSVVLLVPPFAIATADAYRWLDASRTSAVTLSEEPSGNDFESAIEPRHPTLRDYRMRLETGGAAIARLSGSGSTVFGIFDGAPPRLETLPRDAFCIVTRTSSRVVQVEVRE